MAVEIPDLLQGLTYAVHPPRDEWDALCRRPAADVTALRPAVEEIMQAVRSGGDAAVLAYTEQFDGQRPEPQHVPIADDPAVYTLYMPEGLPEAIRRAKENLESFHRSQLPEQPLVETSAGVHCWRERRAIERVGLYIPGGSAPLFSSLLMLGVPARLAACPIVNVCTPPNAAGGLHPSMGYAAHLLGLEAVYLAGGAQAIAAMTYGTETLMPSDKLFGPGNAYVTAAKQLAQLEGTAIDMPAGPSELLVVADGADEAAWVAADLLSQAEHGPDSQVILVTDSASLAEAVPAELERQLADLPRRAIAAEALRQSRLLIFPDLEEALAFSNHYAPEHLIIQTENPRHWALQVVHAGSVFLGRWSCESAGDYNSGTNHTLPTAGAARAYSGVSVDSFVRQITFQQLDAEGLRTLGPDIEAMARAESLEAHARAVARRRQVIPDQ